MAQPAVTQTVEALPSWMTAWKEALVRGYDARPARFDEWFAEAWSSSQGKTWKRSGYGLLVSGSGMRRVRMEVYFRRDEYGSLLGMVTVYPRSGKHPAFPAKRSRALKRRAACEWKHRIRAFGATESFRFVWYGLPGDLELPPAVGGAVQSLPLGRDTLVYPFAVRPNPDYVKDRVNAPSAEDCAPFVNGWTEYPPHW